MGMSLRRILPVLLLPAGWLLACVLQAATVPAFNSPTGIGLAKTSLGQTLVQGKGFTVYYYDLDQISPGESSCVGDCAAAWPPLAAPADAQPTGEWKTVKRDDGSRQWAYQGKPLYLFAGDNKPGDVKGDGLQRFWHAAKYDSPPPTLPRPAGVTIVKAGSTYLLADHQGHVLYAKRGSASGCGAQCARAYPVFAAPALVRRSGAWGIATDEVGTRQWTFKGKPLFTYEGDAKPGDRAGELNPGWQATTVE
jgi:predicted lipoprotein with Yx(FWY)xxD motif